MPVRLLQGEIRSNENEGACCITSDGKYMFFTACNHSGSGGCEIYYSINKNGRWSKPVRGGGELNKFSWQSTPSISADGTTLYFSAVDENNPKNQRSAKTDKDIYICSVSYKKDGTITFSNVKRLGPEINTEYDEISPFINPYNNILYFSSNGHVGLGGLDMYVATRDTAGIWTVPKDYTVPVLMYYGAGVASGKVYSNDIFAREEEFAKQLEYLADNGYSLIGFEDLWNVAEYEKPVIICFDTGYANNYKTVFPLIKKYNAKISVFLSTGLIGTDGYLTEKQIQEMNASNLVTFQSRGVDGESFAFKIYADQEKEIDESVLRIVRLTGKQPSAFSYPYGDMTDITQQLCLQNFKFGCRLRGERAWNTADRPEEIYRFLIDRETPTEALSTFLESSFKDR